MKWMTVLYHGKKLTPSTKAARVQSGERKEVSSKTRVEGQDHWLQRAVEQQRKTKRNILTNHGPCHVADPRVRCLGDSIPFHCSFHTGSAIWG